MPIMASAGLGAGIQRTSDPQQVTGWKRETKLLTHLIVLLGVSALYLVLVGPMAVQTTRGRQTTNGFIQILTGAPSNINAMRLFLFGMTSDSKVKRGNC